MNPRTIGRYEILDELGRGAMGSVLRARDPAMGRIVAVKSIHASALNGDDAEEYRARFYREARAAGALSHPGIVPVFDVGEDNGTPYLVMEFVQGHTLDAALKAGERFSLDHVCEVGKHIAEALGYAHSKGVIHRDIKPANILMTAREVYGDERPRITDFGVAKMAGGDLTTTGQLLGTPAFMPPEQFTGTPIDGRTDIFSLGVILYRMATGEQPFPGETLTAVSYKIVHVEPIPPSRLNPAVSPELDAVILKCLAKKARDRYQTGDELAVELLVAMQTVGSPTPRSSVPPRLIQPVDMPQRQPVAPSSQVPPAQPLRPAAPPAPQPVPEYRADPSAQVSMSGPQINPVWTSRPYPPAPPVVPRVSQSVPPVSHPPTPPSAPVPESQRSIPPESHRSIPPHQSPHETFIRPVAPNRHPDSGMLPTRTPVTESTMPGRPTPATAIARKEKAKGGFSPIFLLLFLAIAAGGTWVFMHTRVQTSENQPDVGAVSAVSSANGDASAQPLEKVDFDPRALDPKNSTALSLDFESLPPALGVTVVFDGKIYWTGTASEKDKTQGLRVPAGRHSLRVLVGPGDVKKSSGEMPADFGPGKGMTMGVKLWPESHGAFDPSSQVIVSLQRDLFS